MDCSIRVVTVLLGYLNLLIATSWGPIFGIWGPPKSWSPRRLPTLPTPKAGPAGVCVLSLYINPKLSFGSYRSLLDKYAGMHAQAHI